MTENQDEYKENLPDVIESFLHSGLSVDRGENRATRWLEEIESEKGTVHFTNDSKQSGIKGDASFIELSPGNEGSRKYIIVANEPNLDWNFEESDHSTDLSDKKETYKGNDINLSRELVNKSLENYISSEKHEPSSKKTKYKSEPTKDSHDTNVDDSLEREFRSDDVSKNIDSKGFPIEYDFANFIGKASLTMAILSINLFVLVRAGTQYTPLVTGVLALSLIMTLAFARTWLREKYR